MDIRKAFGANVRRHRLAAGISQEAVAERMGVDRAFVSSIERGRQNVTLLTIWQAAQALKTRPAELLNEQVRPDAGTASQAARTTQRKPRKSE